MIFIKKLSKELHHIIERKKRKLEKKKMIALAPCNRGKIEIKKGKQRNTWVVSSHVGAWRQLHMAVAPHARRRGSARL